jgi:ribosomal protein S18 acetylase RimI-like enzyme
VRAAAPTLDPAFLAAPSGVSLVVTPGGDADASAVVDMLIDTYWNAGSFSRDEIARAHAGATAWVGARDASGRLIASARAISDGAKYAWIYDVIVAEEFRGMGVGASVVRLLLDHPRVRGARTVWLHTRDAQRLYRAHGFVESSTLPRKPYPRTEMVLLRRPPPASALEVIPCPSFSTATISGALPTSTPASSR